MASEVTRTFFSRMAMASPISAPSTMTGRVTSCPPWNLGVIIGPQQPGGVPVRMMPPLRTTAAGAIPGPTIPPLYS